MFGAVHKERAGARRTGPLRRRSCVLYTPRKKKASRTVRGSAGDRPFQVSFGNDDKGKFSEHADDLGSEDSEHRESSLIDELAVMILRVQLPPIQAEQVGLNIRFRLASVFEDLHLVQRHHGKWGYQ